MDVTNSAQFKLEMGLSVAISYSLLRYLKIVSYMIWYKYDKIDLEIFSITRKYLLSLRNSKFDVKVQSKTNPWNRVARGAADYMLQLTYKI